MSADLDRYEARYGAKLWSLLPELYRAMDGAAPGERGPLEEIVRRIGLQAAEVRRSLDRLWEDQSIESCDDWVIEYIGDLLATNIVASLDARGRRVDVARTIYYRRRKGTVALLEELANNTTGWPARVNEFFLGLARTRHGLDPAIGEVEYATGALTVLQRAQRVLGGRTHTPAGGFADLRSAHGASLAGSAFDEYFHTADVRRGRGATGWHNIPHLGVFVWRLKSYFVRQVTPVQVKARPQEYTFDPTGRYLPLYARDNMPRGDQWVSAREHEVPGPITRDLLRAAFTDLYSNDTPGSLAVSKHNAGPFPYDYVPPPEVRRDPRIAQPAAGFWIDPVCGRIVAPAAGAADDYRVDYHYGFASDIGAGPYERRTRRPRSDLPQPGVAVTGGSQNMAAPLVQLSAAGTGTLTVGDSLTYTQVGPVNVSGEMELRAKNKCRPLVRPPAPADWIFNGISPNATLLLDGLFMSGATLVLTGTFDAVTLRCCTLDPGNWDASANGWKKAADDVALSAVTLQIKGTVRKLVVERSITGPLTVDANAAVGVEAAFLSDSIVQATAPQTAAISMPRGNVTLTRCTILGTASVRVIEVSECILHDHASADDTQLGCVRFSTFAAGSRLPRQYECVALAERAPLFESLDFGTPTFGLLLPTAGERVMTRAEDGSEPGAFSREKTAIKERSLLIKYQEYLPLGLEPLVIHAT